MGKMKDLLIQQLNEDYERMAEKDRAFLIAEKEYMERMIMQQIFEEEQQAKIIEDDTNQELQEGASGKSGLKHAHPATIYSAEGGHKTHHGIQQGAQLAFDFGEDKENHQGEGLSL